MLESSGRSDCVAPPSGQQRPISGLRRRSSHSVGIPWGRKRFVPTTPCATDDVAGAGGGRLPPATDLGASWRPDAGDRAGLSGRGAGRRRPAHGARVRRRGRRGGRHGGNDLRLHRLRRPCPGAGALAAVLRAVGGYRGGAGGAHEPDGGDGDPRHGGGGHARWLRGCRLAADGDRRSLGGARLLDRAGPVAGAARGLESARDRHLWRPRSGRVGCLRVGGRRSRARAAVRAGRAAAEAAAKLRAGLTSRRDPASRASLRCGVGYRSRDLPAGGFSRPWLLGAVDDPVRAQARGQPDLRADRDACGRDGDGARACHRAGRGSERRCYPDHDRAHDRRGARLRAVGDRVRALHDRDHRLRRAPDRHAGLACIRLGR